MTIYIAFLRGINVGRNNIIPMADLKRMFEAIGLSEVQTYIRSGNILFKSKEAEELLCRKIELEIMNVFQLSVPVILRTAAELEQMILNCPFSLEEAAEAEPASGLESLYVSLMDHAPSQDRVNLWSVYGNENNEFRIQGREVFLLLKEGFQNSKLASNLQKLNVPATVRNWNTIGKLVELARGMEV